MRAGRHLTAVRPPLTRPDLADVSVWAIALPIAKAMGSSLCQHGQHRPFACRQLIRARGICVQKRNLPTGQCTERVCPC